MSMSSSVTNPSINMATEVSHSNTSSSALPDTKASQESSPTLLGLPLELRHRIYGFASQRSYGAPPQLRKWFEKQDCKKQIADGWVPTPAVPANNYRHHSVMDESIEDEDVDSGIAIGTVKGQDQEEEEEEEEDDFSDDQSVNDDDLADIGALSAAFTAGIDPIFIQALTGTDPLVGNGGVSAAIDPSSADIGEIGLEIEHDSEDDEDDEELAGFNGPAILASTTVAVGDDEDENMGGTGEEQEQEHFATNEVLDDEVDSNNEAEERDAAIQASATQPVMQTQPTPQRKWQHVTRLIQVSKSPPPVSLLLLNHQLSAEALKYYYDASVLTLNLTRSLAHQTFVEEEIIKGLADAPHSPIEQIRRARIIIVWDTLWLNANEAEIMRPIWEFTLLQRCRQTSEMMSMMPQLQKVDVEYSDSAKCPESACMLKQIEETFFESLQCFRPEVDFGVRKETYATNGERVKSSSIIGKQRTQFIEIKESGQNFR